MEDFISKSLEEAAISFKRGTTEMLILSMLTEQDWYVYDLDRAIKEITNGAFNTKTPQMYTILSRMEQKTFVVAREVIENRRTRVYYQITPYGKKYLNELTGLYMNTNHAIQLVINREHRQKKEA